MHDTTNDGLTCALETQQTETKRQRQERQREEQRQRDRHIFSWSL